MYNSFASYRDYEGLTQIIRLPLLCLQHFPPALSGLSASPKRLSLRTVAKRLEGNTRNKSKQIWSVSIHGITPSGLVTSKYHCSLHKCTEIWRYQFQITNFIASILEIPISNSKCYNLHFTAVSRTTFKMNFDKEGQKRGDQHFD